MRRHTLRRRLYTVLLQLLVLLVIAAGAALVLSSSAVRRHAIDDRLLMARTVARSLDAMLSTAMQDLGRIASELDELDAGAAARLRVFRFQSPFREATYLVDARANLIASDPAEVRPLPPSWLRERELVTSLISKDGSERRPSLAIVQPFRRQGTLYYLVSEMNPMGSPVSSFLQAVGLAPEMGVAVVDENGIVIGSQDQRLLLHAMRDGSAYAERMRAHRPVVIETGPGELQLRRSPPDDVLTVMVPLQFAPWAVVVQQPKALAFSALYATRNGLLVAGAILVVVGLLVSRAFWKSVVTPIQRLSDQAERLRAGDIASPIAVSGDYEVELLAQTLDDARGRLASTMAELKTLNEDLEGQVASRTALIEAKYRDLTLLHAVARLSTELREPERLMAEILRLIATHYGFRAVAILTTRPDGPPSTYVHPPGVALAWLARGHTPPVGWRRREITYQGELRGELFHPLAEGLDEQVMEALGHELATLLQSAQLWARTVAQDEHRQLLVRRLLSATEEERRRLARELHDEISQLLTVIQLSLERVDAASPELAKAKGLLATTQKDIHRIIYDLRPSLLDDLGLSAAIKSHAQEHLVRNGLDVNLEIDETVPARPEIEITTFRIYQELVTNILRHAKAENVSIELYERDGKLILAVEDDGIGFDPTERSEGAGVTGMRERAALVNGTIRCDSEPGLGTHVVLEIPIR